jgi:uncharacterized protein YjbJ (UPF0337 family)
MMQEHESQLDGGSTMKRSDVERAWNQFKSTVQRRWTLLTGDDLDLVAGNYDRLVAKLQDRYGMTRQQAERELDEFRASALG